MPRLRPATSQEPGDTTTCQQQSNEHIFTSNNNWSKLMLAQQPDFFENLSAGQSPDYLWIGCSDSRVPAEAVTGLHPGSMFVHRNIANLVNTSDLNTTSVLVYAVGELRVKHIIVCGHYGCGGIKAAIAPENMGLLTLWLQSVWEVYSQHRNELDHVEGNPDRIDRLAELNVIQQCRNVMEILDREVTSPKQRSYVVHGWIFNLKNGLLEDLHFESTDTPES